MLHIERETNSDISIKRIPDWYNSDITYNVGAFRLVDDSTGIPTDLYLIMDKWDKEKEATIGEEDEELMDSLIQAIFDARPNLDWKYYVYNTQSSHLKRVHSSLHVPSAIIAKFNAKVDVAESLEP